MFPSHQKRVAKICGLHYLCFEFLLWQSRGEEAQFDFNEIRPVGTEGSVLNVCCRSESRWIYVLKARRKLACGATIGHEGASPADWRCGGCTAFAALLRSAIFGFNCPDASHQANFRSTVGTKDGDNTKLRHCRTKIVLDVFTVSL